MTLTDTWIPKAPPLRVDDAGAVRVGKSRVTLTVLLTAYRQGMTAEELDFAFDTIGLSNIYAVISYYLDNRELVDGYLADQEVQAVEIRRKIESQPGYAEFKQKMAERMREYREARE